MEEELITYLSCEEDWMSPRPAPPLLIHPLRSRHEPEACLRRMMISSESLKSGEFRELGSLRSPSGILSGIAWPRLSLSSPFIPRCRVLPVKWIGPVLPGCWSRDCAGVYERISTWPVIGFAHDPAEPAGRV